MNQMIRLMLSIVMLLGAAWPVQAGNGFAVCNQPFNFVGGHHRVIHHAPVVRKKVVHHSNQYAGNVHHNQFKQADVVGALQEIARQQQEHRAMIDGLNALGFASTTYQSQSYQQQSAPPVQYAPYAAAPYQQGTTAYSVQNVQVETFSPSDVREIMASVARHSSEANVGANQLMAEATVLAEKIAANVQANSDAALRVAEIQAETRNVEATAQALVEALKASRTHQSADEPRQQSRASVSVETRTETRAGVVPPDPATVTAAAPDDPAAAAALVKTHCAKCHGANVADPPAGFRLSSRMSADEVDWAVESVVSGDMPKGKDITSEQRMQLVAALQQLER